jgi:hypothetical protein
MAAYLDRLMGNVGMDSDAPGASMTLLLLEPFSAGTTTSALFVVVSNASSNGDGRQEAHQFTFIID